MADETSSSDAVAEAVLRWFDGSAAQGILVTDEALRIRRWNQWLIAATGLTREAVLGRNLFEVIPSLVERGLDQYFADALTGHVKVLSHAFHRYIIPTQAPLRADGQMPQTARIAPLTHGSRVVGTITLIDDVSERVASDQELRGRIAAAEAASRVKDEFLATLSHEIRTPLNAVLGWTRILRSRKNLDAATLERAVEVIDRNASAQLTLVSDMLDMARISSGKVRLDMTDVDMGSVVIAAIDAVRPAADAKGVRLITDLAPQLATVSGDADRLLQVVWNLLSNAVKFTEHGGQVTLGLSTENRSVVLAVTDTGQGITPGFLPQIFERFKQADPSSSRRHGGLGLGLALVKELVELHGGSVSVTSAGPGEGSTFRVRLPAKSSVDRSADRGSRPVVTAAPAASGSLNGVRILVVEDDPDSAEILVQTVSAAGATALCTSSAAEALAVLQEMQADCPHAIITDIGMPDQDGYRFLRDVRNLSPECGGALPVIALTAYASPVDRTKALRAGFAAHVAKPFAPDTLVAEIARVIE
jgi:PAS domain S-box-containing protein